MRILVRLLSLPLLLPLTLLEGAYALKYSDLERWTYPVNERFSDWVERTLSR